MKEFFQGELVTGIERVIDSGLKFLLGNTTAGEVEDQNMFIVWLDNALLRIDFYHWRYNLSSEAFMIEKQNIFATLMMKRVVDLRRVDPQVMSYCVTNAALRMGRDESDAKKDIQQAIEMLKSIEKIYPTLAAVEKTAHTSGPM